MSNPHPSHCQNGVTACVWHRSHSRSVRFWTEWIRGWPEGQKRGVEGAEAEPEQGLVFVPAAADLGVEGVE